MTEENCAVQLSSYEVASSSPSSSFPSSCTVVPLVTYAGVVTHHPQTPLIDFSELPDAAEEEEDEPCSVTPTPTTSVDTATATCSTIPIEDAPITTKQANLPDEKEAVQKRNRSESGSTDSSSSTSQTSHNPQHRRRRKSSPKKRVTPLLPLTPSHDVGDADVDDNINDKTITPVVATADDDALDLSKQPTPPSTE